MKTLLGYPLALLATLALGACSSAGESSEEKVELGDLGMSLLSVSQDGVTYRLRNATFDVTGEYWYWYYYTPVDPTPETVSVSSETDPDAASINLSLEQGYYYVYLNSGWSLEKVEADGTATPVEAQLLSNNTQYLYVYPHGTAWVSYNFGIGDHDLWFTGQAEIHINVYDDPDQYYGSSMPSSFADGGAPPVVSAAATAAPMMEAP